MPRLVVESVSLLLYDTVISSDNVIRIVTGICTINDICISSGVGMILVLV
jgi:hypothetical protein